MKKLLGGVALCALLAAPAMAADLPARMPVKAPVAVASMYNWSGLYIGGHAGYQWGETEWAFPVDGTVTGHDLDGFVGGGHAGIQWQWGQFVLGVEGAVSGFGRDGSSACGGGFTCHSEIDHFWRAGVRAGFATGASGNWLIYGMGGFARAKLDTHLVPPGGVASFGDSTHHHGYYVGGGIEHAWTPNFIIGVEAYHVSLDTERHFIPGGVVVPGFTRDADLDFFVVQARASWKFGWGGPVVARY